MDGPIPKFPEELRSAIVEWRLMQGAEHPVVEATKVDALVSINECLRAICSALDIQAGFDVARIPQNMLDRELVDAALEDSKRRQKEREELEKMKKEIGNG
jgi:hypothetical protein